MSFRRAARAPLALALQGGGAHGAFTWGVLDALLEHGAHPVRAISGTSAGAINAVVLAQGWLEGGPDGARAALAKFWRAVGTRLPFEWFTVRSGDEMGLTPSARAMLHWTRYLSPYQLNPLDLNPLRDLLREQVDFERLRASGDIRLFIAATHANTGRLRVFRTRELGVEPVLASTCLPSLHRAIEIDGQPYWDGGYSANPALFPLIVDGGAPDLLIVMLSPLAHAAAPRTAQDIHDRTLEFAFNATFLREARLLGEAHAVARRSWLPLGALERRLARTRFHLIDAQDPLGALASETRLIAHLPFLEHLRDRGIERAGAWLRQHGGALGHRSSVDLARLFGPASPRRRSAPGTDGPEPAE